MVAVATLIFEQPSERFEWFQLLQKPLHHLFWTERSAQKLILTKRCNLNRLFNAFGIKNRLKSAQTAFQNQAWMCDDFQVPQRMDSWSIFAGIGVPNFGTISQIWVPELNQICLHRQSRLQDSFWTAFRSNLGDFGTPIVVNSVLWAYEFHDNLVFKVQVASKPVRSFLKPRHARCKVLCTSA